MPSAVTIQPESAPSPITAPLRLGVDSEGSLEYLEVGPKLGRQLFGDTDAEYASMKLLGSQVLAESRVYPVMIREDAEEAVELHSLWILQKYGSNFSVDKCRIQPITRLVHLDTVVMTYPPEVYELLQRHSRDTIVSILAKETDSSVDDVIVRKGDRSRSLNGTVIHCEPTEQGIMDRRTRVVVLKGDPITEEEDFESAAAPKVDTLIDIDPMAGSVVFGRKQAESQKLKTRCLKRDTIEEYTSFKREKEETEYTVCLSSDDMQELGLLRGDIVRMRDVFVRVLPFVDPNGFSRGYVYCSPVLLMNLEWPKEVVLKTIDAPINSTIQKLVPLATSVVLARVATPASLDRTLQQAFLSNLKTFFEKKPRVVRMGQYIPIPIDSEMARAVDDVMIPDTSPDTVVWFKVTGGAVEDKEEGEIPLTSPAMLCLVRPDRTRMIQSGVVSETVPYSEEVMQYLGLPTLFDYPGGNTFQYADRLRNIIRTAFRNTQVPLETIVLLSSSARSMGKSTLVRSVAAQLNASIVELDGYEVLNAGSPGKTIGTIRGKVDRMVENCSRLVVFIRHVEALAVKGDPQQQQQQSQQQHSLSQKLASLAAEYCEKQGVVVVFSTNDPDTISDDLRSRVKFELTVSVPSSAERKIIFEHLLQDYSRSDDVSLDSLAMQSAGLSAGDLASVVESAYNEACDEIEVLAEKEGFSVEQLRALNGGPIKLSDANFDKSINKARGKNSDSIGAPKIPDVKWEDVGGLENVKGEILDTIDMPLKHPELFGDGVRKRSGILFYGPPGTGKTLLAKAIATNFSLNFFSVRGPELLNMYIGESEANVRRVFQKARDAKPCVIFFDELDSVAPKRGNQGDSGGVMDRIVSQLLAELDGMSGADGSGDGVFVVGATNRPDLLDEALLRPGRFDKMLYLGISDTHQKQAKIIEALTRKFRLAADFRALDIASKCPYNYTGADFYAMCSDAMLNAMTRTAGAIDAKIKAYNESRPGEKDVSTRYYFDYLATEEDTEVEVTFADFDKARSELIPSVSADELDHYLDVKRGFEGGK